MNGQSRKILLVFALLIFLCGLVAGLMDWFVNGDPAPALWTLGGLILFVVAFLLASLFRDYEPGAPLYMNDWSIDDGDDLPPRPRAPRPTPDPGGVKVERIQIENKAWVDSVIAGVEKVKHV